MGLDAINMKFWWSSICVHTDMEGEQKSTEAVDLKVNIRVILGGTKE